MQLKTGKCSVWLMLGFLFFLLMGPLVQAETVDQIMSRFQDRYDDLDSFSAEFDQLFQGRTHHLRESGVVMMRRPDKMYWEYESPTPKFFVSDGYRSYFYVPRDKQVIVSEQHLREIQSPLLFLLGEGNIQEAFNAEFNEREEALEPANKLIKLIPKEPQGEFSFLILEVNLSDYLIRRLIVVEPIGNRNEYILSNVQINIQIPDEQFDFEVPAGTELISH
ncbi:MAG: outer membrane lipoprotein carrier protein LolA [Acidobacteriota bacterium]|nr:outer membrane lipoprotein carrier protein LolA [Acidobacteriota bacterium]